MKKVYRIVCMQSTVKIDNKKSKICKSINNARVVYFPPKPPYFTKQQKDIWLKQISVGLPYSQWENEAGEWHNRILDLAGDPTVEFSEDNGKTWKESI